MCLRFFYLVRLCKRNNLKRFFGNSWVSHRIPKTFKFEEVICLVVFMQARGVGFVVLYSQGSSGMMRGLATFSRITWSLTVHCFKITLGSFLKLRYQVSKVRIPLLITRSRSPGFATLATREGESVTNSFKACRSVT